MKNILKSFLLIVSFSFLATVHAETEAVISNTPLDIVKNTSEQVLERLRNDAETMQSDPSNINGLVDELITPNFDFAKMSRWVLGKNWRKATDEQKIRFNNAFQKLLIRTYAKALVETKDVEINYLPVHTDAKNNRTTIKTQVDRGNGSPLIPINYRLYKKGENWKVYDVAVNGVSLVSTYRGSFNNEIKTKGLDSLINNLENRT